MSNLIRWPRGCFFPGFSGDRRDSMDRNSQTAFSPSLMDQYNKNKPGWPNYGPLGNPAGISSSSWADKDLSGFFEKSPIVGNP